MNAAKVLEDLKRRFPNEPEYHQAVEEVLGTIEEEYNKHPEFDKVNLIERLCIPDRVYQFRVTWMDDKGNIQTNMGYRVQHNNAIAFLNGFHRRIQIKPFKLSRTLLHVQVFAHGHRNGQTFQPLRDFGKVGKVFDPPLNIVQDNIQQRIISGPRHAKGR